MLYICVKKKRARVHLMWLRYRLGQVEAYLTVREVLSEVSTAADCVVPCVRSGFYQCRYATLGLTLNWLGG